MSGLASGLRAKVWVSAPASPRAAPTSTATSVCGSRSSMTMNCWPASPPPSRVRSTSATRDLEVARARGRATTSTHSTPRPPSWPRPARSGTSHDAAPTPQRGRRGSWRPSDPHHPGAADQHDEDRAADQAITMPTCSSPGRTTTRPEHVGEDQQQPAQQRGVRDHPAVVDAGEEAGRRAARRGRRTRSGRRRRWPPRPAASRRATPTTLCRVGCMPSDAGDVVAELEQVERRGADRGEHQSDER